ncbi:hypothetical protein J6590_060731 [Homalodisca vitripennis]|nr:hypothetical protein J6590_060731 [Homalodisca vitripennis]
MSGLCVICNQKISSEEVIVCIGNCGRVFHYECASERYASLKTRGSKKEWTCDDCRPKQLTSATKNVGMEETPATNHDALLSENYKDLKKENKELKDSNKVLCEEVNSLKTRVRLAEQYSRKCNVEIQGIPVTTNEDAVSLATDVGAALGVVLSVEDVMAAHRVPTFRPRAAPPLVVQLRDRRMKETIVAAYKKKKELKASEINKVFTNNKVYVNDHLTPETKHLLRLTKEKSRQWKIINSLTGTNNRNNIETLTLDSGRVLNDSQEIADEINKYLVNEWWGTGVSHSAKKPIRQSACKHSIPTAVILYTCN